MKLRKLFLVISLLMLHCFAFSQSENINVKTQIQLEETNCSDQTVIRTIDIQMFYGDTFNHVKKIETKKCIELYTLSRLKGKFKAVIRADNYLSSEINFEITETSTDTLYLKTTLYKQNKAKILNEVVVNSTSPSLIKTEGNKTSYLVKNNDILNNGSALETIQKLPGVMNDINGNVTLKGKSVTIFVDGLPTNMSGQDLTNYLNNP